MANKNIWVAAGDGDLERVKVLKHTATNPNAPDPFTYTPMYEASLRGNVNITDSDATAHIIRIYITAYF
ncbi:hypothetical protein MPER_07392, partial [Moniliophthora perniciosa FA553]